MVGFWQIAIIAYVLFLAIGPRRVVRWLRIVNRTMLRMQGRPAPPPREPTGLLKAIGVFEHGAIVGWSCVAVGFALLVVDGVCRQSGCAFQGPPMLLLAMVFFFAAPWFLA